MLARYCPEKPEFGASSATARETHAGVPKNVPVMHSVAGDFDYARALQTADTEVVGLIAAHFLEQAPKQILDMHSAWTARDLPKLHRLAHSFRGLFANFNAQPLADICLRIERLAAADSTAGFEEELAELERIFPVFARVLEQSSVATQRGMVAAG